MPLHAMRVLAATIALRMVSSAPDSEDDAFGILLRAVHGAWPAGLNHTLVELVVYYR